jgi:hypothetical protein
MKNGDFEEGPYISQVYQWVVLVPPTNENILSPLPGWKIMSYSKSVKYIGSSGFAVPKGERAVELMSGLETALVQDQDVDTVGGASYRLEFMVGDAEGTCAASDSPMEDQRAWCSSAPGTTPGPTAAARSAGPSSTTSRSSACRRSRKLAGCFSISVGTASRAL